MSEREEGLMAHCVKGGCLVQQHQWPESVVKKNLTQTGDVIPGVCKLCYDLDADAISSTQLCT